MSPYLLLPPFANFNVVKSFIAFCIMVFCDNFSVLCFNSNNVGDNGGSVTVRLGFLVGLLFLILLSSIFYFVKKLIQKNESVVH